MGMQQARQRRDRSGAPLQLLHLHDHSVIVGQCHKLAVGPLLPQLPMPTPKCWWGNDKRHPKGNRLEFKLEYHIKILRRQFKGL